MAGGKFDQQSARRIGRSVKVTEGRNYPAVPPPRNPRRPQSEGGPGTPGGGWAILIEDCIGAISTLDVDDQGVASGQIHLGGALNINGAPIAGALAYKLIRKYEEEPDPTVVGWDLIYIPSNQEVRLFTMVGAKTAKGKTVQYKVIDGRAVIDVEDCAI